MPWATKTGSQLRRRIPRQGQDSAASIFFSTSSSFPALASASATAPFMALELY